MDLFRDHHIPMWGATAYKGAEFESEDLPDLTQRQINCQSWADAATRYNLTGVIATAWSRYSTDRVQDSPIDAALDALVLCGNILRDGKPPADCLAPLDALGERDRFESCHAAMQQLQDSRKSFWRTVQYLREGLACATLDPRRRASGTPAKYLVNLQGHYDLAQAAAAKARLAFKNLIPDLWLDRYLQERLLPMLEELRHLTPQVKAVTPAT